MTARLVRRFATEISTRNCGRSFVIMMFWRKLGGGGWIYLACGTRDHNCAIIPGWRAFVRFALRGDSIGCQAACRGRDRNGARHERQRRGAEVGESAERC